MHPIDEHYRPGFARAFGRWLARVNGVWFRYQLRGTWRVPAGGCLFVGNHSAIGIADVLCLLGGWTLAFGTTRRAVGMMHKMFVQAPIVGHIARAFGAVYADPENAREALARGWAVACFPGGDLDACRPVTEARLVHFGPRRGYVRLALAQGVPVVPVATVGSHYTYTLLPGGAWIARVTRMKRWARCERFPLVLGVLGAFAIDALAVAGIVPWWCVALAAVAALVPNPVRITTEILAPIDVCALTAHITDPAARVEAAHALVYGALSEAVATIQHRAVGAPALEG